MQKSKVNLKKWLKHALLFLAILGIIDSVFAINIGGGINFGTTLPGTLGFIILLWYALKDAIISRLPKRVAKMIASVTCVLFSMMMLSFLVIEGMIIFSVHSDQAIKADYVLVLGAGLNGDQVSLTLQQRLDKAWLYAKQHEEAQIIVSGGQGTGEWITEAEAMKKYLVSKGIPKERILSEDRATSTMENLQFTKEMIQDSIKSGKNKIMIVTSDFHLFRARFLANRVGFKAYGIPSGTPYYLWPNCYIREYLAVVKSYFLDH